MVDQKQKERLARLSKNLPPVRFGAFEFWFDYHDRIDLNILLSSKSEKVSLITKSLNVQTEESNRFNIGSALQDYLESWAINKEDRQLLINRIWLSYDNLSQSPWCYFCFAEHILANDNYVKYHTIRSILNELSISNNEKRNIATRKLVNSFPKSNFLLGSFAIQIHKQQESIRFYVEVLSIADLFELLSVIEWNGDIKHLGTLLEAITDECSKFGVTFNLREEFESLIGIEIWFNDSIVQRHLENFGKQSNFELQQKKIDAYQNWKGEDQFSIQGHRYVVDRKNPEYFKIVLNGNELVSVKGYLFFELRS